RVFAEEQLARELGVVAGVAGVDVSGGVEEEVRVNVDLNRLQALGIGLTDVLDELRNRNQDISGGRILGEDSEALTRTVGRFQNAEEIRNLSFPITSSESNIAQRIYLRDFAQIIDDTEQQRLSVLLNKEPAVKISIQKQPDANTINVVDAVKKKITELEQSGIIPQGTLLTTTLDESQFIRNSINNVTASGLIGTLLAAISVLLFLGSLRQTFIIVLAIPLATLAAIILMGVFGLSLNVFSLGGLALGVGIVVDNSIVMLENMATGMRQGEGERGRQGENLELITPNSSLLTLNFSTPSTPSPPSSPSLLLKQAEQSSREVESALIASTSTNLVVVLPFLLIGGLISLLFNELILTISFAVAASILIAVTVVPMLTSRMLRWKVSSKVNQLWFFKEFNHRFNAATRIYGNLLRNIVGFRWLTILVTVLFLSGSCLWMIPQIPKEILPRINTGRAILFASFPPGTTLETNQKVMTAVDDILLQQPETEYVFSTVGGFIFSSTTIENPLRSSSNITLKSGTDIEAYVEKVNQEFNQLNLAGIRLRLFPGRVRGLILNNSPVRGADIDIILQGENQQSLEQAGRQVLQALDEQITSARFRPDADKPQPEIQIRPDWERVVALGLTTEDIGDTINTAIQGSIPTQLQRGNRLVDVRVQLDEASVKTASQLERLPLFVNNNYQVRLSDVANIVKGKAPGEIQRINQRQVFIIAGNLSEKANLSQALAEVDNIIEKLELPPGVRVLPSYNWVILLLPV
ncbi:MAG: efflux RND transporter permease subunit, partial [Cyanobacteria bacterium J06641_2]